MLAAKFTRSPCLCVRRALHSYMHHHHHHHHRHHHRRRHQRPQAWMTITIDGVSISAWVPPEGRIRMSTQVSIGHFINLAIKFLDQHDNPMVEAPVLDAVPAWTQSNTEAETLVANLDGMSAIATPAKVGSDTISLELSVGGVKFVATLDVNVIPEVQVLTSIVIEPTVV